MKTRWIKPNCQTRWTLGDLQKTSRNTVPLAAPKLFTAMHVYVPASDMPVLDIVRVPVSEICRLPPEFSGERARPPKYQVKLRAGSGKVEQGMLMGFDKTAVMLRVGEVKDGGAA